VTLGGRRVPVQRPRVRAADGSGELPVPAYELFNSTELLGRLAMEKMLAGLSTRRYAPAGLEPVGEQVTATGKSTSKSAVSRKFIASTETALTQLLAADLSGLDLVALMVDAAASLERGQDWTCDLWLWAASPGLTHGLVVRAAGAVRLRGRRPREVDGRTRLESRYRRQGTVPSARPAAARLGTRCGAPDST
jgi:hypothetical protein